ncbi:MAG: tyrosine-type recombinase/integrase, partial [Lentisphaeria bacterium]|nr:tyrosine-type recombinase/integrase [Lentisphaeria bacterium]
IKLKIGTVYQKEPNGVYYFRYQVNGARKAISLKTRNKQEAVKEAEKHVPLLQATSSEVIAAHVQYARNLATPEKNLLLSQAWDEYEKSPDRATPATVSEALAYKSTFLEFVAWVNDPAVTLRDITGAMAMRYADSMRELNIAVSTHNRKLKRIRKVFNVLKEYRGEENPFNSAVLYRKEREEREQDVHRLSFTREQEEQLREVLDDDRFKVMNKPEVKVVYYLGMYTGQRMKDCVLLRWSKINLEMRRIWVKQFKTGKEVTIPIAPPLLEVLQVALAWKKSDADYVCPNVAVRYNKTNAVGKNVGNNLVNIDMLRVIKWIGLEPSVTVPGRDKKVTVYGFHSLRHSFASYCAAAGVPQATVVSILGADSEVITRYYTHVGDDAQRQAIAAVSGGYLPGSAQAKIDEALELINTSNAASDEILVQVKAILEK